MCTVSWLRRDDGYTLLCNRDERHTRLPAAGPRLGSVRGVSYVAPIDGDHGGSWIGANEYGLTLCLLNRYGESSVGGKGFVSRGLLLKDLLDSRSVEHVRERVRQLELEWFQPFTLLALSLNEPELLFEWTGSELRIQDAPKVPLTSSAVKVPDVLSMRRDLFATTVSSHKNPDLQLLREFHRSHLPERGPASVCMHRDDAGTVSLSIVTVNRDAVEFSYQPGPPCEAASMERKVLPRSGLASQATGP